MSRLCIPSGRNGAKAVEPEGPSAVSKTPTATAAPKVTWVVDSTPTEWRHRHRLIRDFPVLMRRVSSSSRITSIAIIKFRRVNFQIAAEEREAIQTFWWPTTPFKLTRGILYYYYRPRHQLRSAIFLLLLFYSSRKIKVGTNITEVSYYSIKFLSSFFLSSKQKIVPLLSQHIGGSHSTQTFLWTNSGVEMNAVVCDCGCCA